jgi:hypothetical protein
VSFGDPGPLELRGYPTPLQTGMRDFARSRDLFLKATWADPRAPLPPYNLACAYALLNDEASAAKALKLAVSVGGPKVQARAKKDADFKGVLAAPWFRSLTD